MTRAFLAVVVLVGLGLGPTHVAGAARLPLPERVSALAVDEAGGSVTQRDAAAKAGEIPGEGLPASSAGSTPYVIELAPGERVRVLTVEQSRALHASGGPVMTLAMLGVCESGLDASAIGAAGERGAFQVIERYWGAVPVSLDAQAIQVAAIVREHGTGPWTTRDGCAKWSLQ